MLGRAGTSGYEPYQKCTYLPYTYTITVALIYNRVYNTCVSDTFCANWCYVGFTDPTAGAESTSLVNASDSSEHC